MDMWDVLLVKTIPWISDQRSNSLKFGVYVFDLVGLLGNISNG
jgi:hypothetical protein